MFNSSKYTRWYETLMTRAQGRVLDGYVELHHIKPKSLGGTDERENLVQLNAKEHFVAHHLLTKMCLSETHTTAMWNAFFLMHTHSTANRYYVSRTYELAKRFMAEHKKTLTGDKNHFFGATHSEEARAKMRAKRAGRVCRQDHTQYTFTHKNGDVFSGTQREFYNTYKLCNKGVNMIAKGREPTYKGWSCKKGTNG